MMANVTQEGVKYDVCFVQVGNSPDESSEILRLAFEAMDSNQMEPTWVTLSDCLKISKKEPKLFVVDPFEGEAFEHLKTFQNRIVGPLCVLYCLQYSDFLPKRSYPVYSVSMRKITVSCSNIQAKMREDISTRVQLMGGFFSKDLTKSVTHLVVGEVGSQKYKVAANFGLPIMVPEWITDVWENGQYKQLHATDSCYDKYKCPVFKGLVITVSQLSAEERLAIKAVIEDNGGVYSGALKANETTHLVLNEPTGDKYRFAKNWKVICVNVNWIYDSVEAGYCRDETLYGLDEFAQPNPSQPKRSTPKKDLTLCDLPLVDCSVIAANPAVSHLDETMRSEVSIPLSNRKSVHSTLDEFNLSSLPKYGQFLDGCKIFLTGFNAVHMDKLRKIVNSGSGMRFSKYSDSISHVVCGELSEEILQNIRSSSVKPYVVNFKWLLECCKNEKLVEEKPYLCMDVTTLSPEKNEVKEVKQDTSLHMSQNTSQPKSSQQLKNSQTQKKEDFTNDNMMDIFKQYINDPQLEDDKENSVNKPNNLNSKSVSESDKNRSSNLKLNKEPSLPQIPDIDLENKVDNVQGHPPGEKHEDMETEVENEENSENLFLGLKFVIIGFGQKDSEILSSMIDAHSGTILNEVRSSCDITVVPLIWHDLNIPISNIVTNCWLQKCIEDSRIYDFDENDLFRPFDISPDKKPFESFVISFSQYAGTERDCLVHLAESLGAVCQEYFVRRANAAKEVYANTHLVVATPDGSKYEASKKWKIPAVTKRWVIDAAKMGIAPDINEYLTEKFPEFSPSAEEMKAVENCSISTKKEKHNVTNVVKPEKSINISQNEHLVELQNESRQKDTVKSSSPKSCAANIVNTKIPDWEEKAEHIPKITDEVPRMPLQHSRIAELCNESHQRSINKLSPLRPGADNSLNASLSLDQTHNFKFHVSGILNDLDASVSRESIGGGRKSLPVEEMFSRNLASALRRIDEKSNSEKAVDDKIKEQRNSTSEKSNVLSGIVLYVSRKLANIQSELNEIVVLLGGDYIWSYDNSCTHFVFIGKQNDITREFREARAQQKKIVSPEWVYACRDKGVRVDEDLFPHTYKANMTLSQQISILKAPSQATDGPEQTASKIQSEVEKHAKKDGEKVLNPEETPEKSKEADFNKQLNELLVAAKSAKKRHSKRIGGSVSSSPVSNISPVQKLQRHLSDVYIRPINAENQTEEPPDTGSQHSQAYPIMWDDPTGRLEREKIAARAAENMNVTNKSEIKKNVEVIDIALTQEETKSAVKKFMFTNISDALKSEYETKVKKLGGEVSDEKAFDMTASHLILSNPIKNEKFLSSVASGKWVLHPDYLSASIEQNKFVGEEEYEWGGPSSDRFIKNLPANNAKIAKCPYKWRSHLQKGLISFGAFDSWKVVIHADDKTKLATYIKILESGGAEIIPSDSAEFALDRISHVFVDVKKRSSNKIDLSSYISHNIKCVKPEYLAFYLIEDPPPDIDNFLVAEAKEQLGGSSTSKRRNLSSSRQSKKTRLK